jgi:hypothetical protein
MDATSGIALDLKTGVPTYQVEDEAHESPRTTTLYDRTDDWLTLGEIEKISV